MKRPNLCALKVIAWLLCGILLTACLHNKPHHTDLSVVKEVRLEGIVINIPDKANLELALLALDEQNRPRELLAVERYKATGNTFSFSLSFDLNKAKQFKSIELRGRVSQTGSLIGYLSTWHKEQPFQKELKDIILEFAN